MAEDTWDRTTALLGMREAVHHVAATKRRGDRPAPAYVQHGYVVPTPCCAGSKFETRNLVDHNDNLMNAKGVGRTNYSVGS